MIKEDVTQVVWDIIQTYDLHHDYDAPLEFVTLEPLEGLFPLIERDLTSWGIDGFVIPPQEPITEDNPAIITVNSRLDWFHRRLAYAHEIGHALYGHEGAFNFSELDQWHVDREEREAWQVAATMLVPVEAICIHGDASRIAQICRVPEWLVGLAAK